MSFKRKKIEYISVDQFNELMEYIKNYKIIYRSPEEGERIGQRIFLCDKITKIELTLNNIYTGTSKSNNVCTYIVDKNNKDANVLVTGMNAYTLMQRYYKTPKLHDADNAPLNCAGLLYKNDKLEGQRYFAIGYDINSAYSWGMLQPQPDTSKPLGPGILEKGQIGFDKPDTLILEEGYYCEYRFPEIDSPYKEFVNHYYELKKNAKTRDEKIKAKSILNLSVGYLQRTNCFIRANIIGRCNRRINYLIKKYKKNILYSNTDSIVSTCKIPEIENDLGNEIGQWKIEHLGNFAFLNFNYQWDLETPSARGMAKSWYPEGFDLIKDNLKKNEAQNIFVFDKEQKKLVRNENKI